MAKRSVLVLDATPLIALGAAGSLETVLRVAERVGSTVERTSFEPVGPLTVSRVVKHEVKVEGPCKSGALAVYAMTRANEAVMLPPSPMNACVKFPLLRTNVESPSPMRLMSTFWPAHALNTTRLWL